MRRKLEDLTVKQLEKTLDRWFSKFVRLRDADENGVIKCCTCGRFRHWKDSDCGHYSKRNKAHRFTEQNCHAQCRYCNDRMKGEADKHAIYIDNLYGKGTAMSLRESENIIIKRNREWYLTKIEHYKKEVKKLAQQKSIEL